MKHQDRLLVVCLDRDKAHVRPGHRFAYGLSISSIVLVALDVRLHIGWRYQPDLMAKFCQLPRPVMGCCAGSYPNQARFEPRKELNDMD